MGAKKIRTSRFEMRIPSSWAVELAAIAAEKSLKDGQLYTVQDLIRISILKTYFLLKGEIMPRYKSYKPKRIVDLPKLDALISPPSGRRAR